MSTLPQDLKNQIEEKRRKALQLRASKLQQQQSNQSSTPAPQSSQTFYNRPPSSYPKKQSSNLTKSSSFSNSFKNSGGSSRETLSPIAISGSLVLISKERFALVMPYHQPTIVVVKEIPGREYDLQSKQWHFPLAQYNKVVAALNKMKPNVSIGELPQLVIDTFVHKKYGYTAEVDLTRITSSMRATLRSFQVDGVKYAISRGGRVLIADDMGLGKTIQALAIADYYRDEWPLLIVCPSSMRYQWVEEIRKHLVDVDQGSILVITNGKNVLKNYYKVVITSYDLMTTFKGPLLAQKFGVIVMDESHHLKNPKTLRTKTGSELVQNCKRCILLSGTPVLSRPVELHCQLKCIKPHIFKNFHDFAIRYCEAKQNRFGWDYSGSSNMAELSLVLNELLMIRRLKTEVLAQLPPKTREVVSLEGAGKKLSETSELAKVLETEGLKGFEKRSTLLAYFQETANAKKEGVIQYIKDMIENGTKFLVFAYHSVMMDAICAAIEAKRADYIRIDGSVASEVRQQLCCHFQEQESCLVAVLSIKAANTGLTFTAASLVIFAELYWNPGDLIQAEDRAHRIGQEDSVLVQYLVQRGTADDQVWPLIQKKLDVLNKAKLAQDEFGIDNHKVMKIEAPKQSTRDITDYFLDEDDVALAGLDLDGIEKSFEVTDEIPEKRQRLE